LALSLLLPAGAQAGAARCGEADAGAGFAPNGASLHTRDVSDSAAARAPLRVFAIQYKQSPAYVTDAATFERKMRCLLDEYVRPQLHDDVLSDRARLQPVRRRGEQPSELRGIDEPPRHRHAVEPRSSRRAASAGCVESHERRRVEHRFHVGTARRETLAGSSARVAGP